MAREHHVSLRRQLAAGLEAAIRDGHIRPGSALPSTRDMARRTGLHRSTVTAAYARLRSRGWATGQEGGRYRACTPGSPDPTGGDPGVPVRLRQDLDGGGARPENAAPGALARQGLGRILTDARRSGVSRTDILSALASLVSEVSGPEPSRAIVLFEPRPGLRAALAAELVRQLGVPVTAVGHVPQSDSRSWATVIARAEVLAQVSIRRHPPILDAVPLRLSGGTRERGYVRRVARTGLVTLVSVSRTVRGFAEELAAREFERGVSFRAVAPCDPASVVRAIAASRLVLFDEPSRRSVPPTATPAHPIRLIPPARIASLRAYIGHRREVRPGT